MILVSVFQNHEEALRYLNQLKRKVFKDVDTDNVRSFVISGDNLKNPGGRQIGRAVLKIL
ncbi:MAG: hypothetical protein HC896_11425 [Bacteroidales bacterium]|nr:hypothetical protein [Bacteroidales bacterium]